MWAFTLLVSNLRVCNGEFLSESIIWSADFRCLLSESKEMYFLWTNNIWTFWIPLVDGFSQYVNINRISFLTKLVGELSCCTMWLKSVLLDLVLLHYCVRVWVLELACSNTELCLLVLLSLSLSSSLSFVIIIMVMMLCQVHICSIFFPVMKWSVSLNMWTWDVCGCAYIATMMEEIYSWNEIS